MSVHKSLSTTAIGLLLVTTACEPAPPAASGVADSHQSVVGANGLRVNGIRLNGVQFNGMKINGVQFNGMRINGTLLSGLTVDGSFLQSRSAADGQPVAGQDLIGATFGVTLDDSRRTAPALMRIDNVVPDSESPTPDVWLYSMSLQASGDTAWQSACLDKDNNPEPLVAIKGYLWDEQSGARSADPDFVTLACASGAVASCARWGYRPWASAQTSIPQTGGTTALATVSLLDHHQACIYLKRADYCGDGTFYTANGTTIDVYDSLTPALQSQVETSWPIEAGWGPQGATCVSTQRHPEYRFSGRCQRGEQQLLLPGCHESNAFAGALLFDNVPLPD